MSVINGYLGAVGVLAASLGHHWGGTGGSGEWEWGPVALGRCPSANLGTGDDSTFLVGRQGGRLSAGVWGHCLPGGPDSFAGKARAKHPAGPALQQKLLSARLQLDRQPPLDLGTLGPNSSPAPRCNSLTEAKSCCCGATQDQLYMVQQWYSLHQRCVVATNDETARVLLSVLASPFQPLTPPTEHRRPRRVRLNRDWQRQSKDVRTRATHEQRGMLGPPCLSPARWGSLAGLGSMHAHHTSRQPSPASLSGRAICVRPWPDSVLPRALFPLVQEGRLPSLLVHPASLPIPPLWVTQRRLSSGQLAVSCPPARRTTLRTHNPIAADFRAASMRREDSFCRFAAQKHRKAASPVQNFARFLNSRGTASQALQLYRTTWQPVVSYLLSLHVFFVSFSSVEVFPYIFNICHHLLAYLPSDRPTRRTVLSMFGVVSRRT